MMRPLSDIPLDQKDDWLADMGEKLADGTLTEEQAALLMFGDDPYYSYLADQDSHVVPARPQLI